MSDAAAPCPCPHGHDDTVKLLSTVSVGGTATAVQASTGCCGGACGCR
jgi:hypothetical protein